MTSPAIRLHQNLALPEIPSLNGLRAIAAFMVIGMHAVSRTFPGHYAVTLFVVLSGFLITWLLSTEVERAGRIDVRKFYRRRARRLLPAFYAWWILTFLVCFLTIGTQKSMLWSAFYLSDYYEALSGNGMFWWFAHTWSLSVEEQFYLFWPFAFWWLNGKRFRFRLLWTAILAVQVLRLYAGPRHQQYFTFAFETKMDALLLGCVVAMWLRTRPELPRWLFLRFAWIVPLAAFSLILTSDQAHAVLFGNTIAAYASALLIVQYGRGSQAPI